MDKFRDVYRQASEELPRLNMDAEKVQDELHHRKMQQRRQKRLIAKGCAAATVFFLCGAGTAVARNYWDSIIKVNDNGYTITGGAVEQDACDIPNLASVMQMGGGLSREGTFPECGGIETFSLNEFDGGAMDEECEIIYEDAVFMVEYESVKDFLAASEVAAAIPDTSLLGMDFTFENVQVTEDGREVFVRLSNDDVYFFMSQSDVRGYESYSSATSFGEKSRNERSFINSQGLSYVVFDTADEQEEHVSVHAVISVEGRNLCISFRGFDEEDIDRILYELDLSVYFQQ